MTSREKIFLEALSTSSKGKLKYDRHWTNGDCSVNDAFCLALASVARETEEAKLDHFQSLCKHFNSINDTATYHQDDKKDSFSQSSEKQKVSKKKKNAFSTNSAAKVKHAENDSEHICLPLMHPVSPVDRALEQLERQRKEEVATEQMKNRTRVEKKRREIFAESRKKLKEALQIKMDFDCHEGSYRQIEHYPSSMNGNQQKNAEAVSGKISDSVRQQQEEHLAQLSANLRAAKEDLRHELLSCNLTTELRNVFDVLLLNVDEVLTKKNENELNITLKQLKDSIVWMNQYRKEQREQELRKEKELQQKREREQQEARKQQELEKQLREQQEREFREQQKLEQLRKEELEIERKKQERQKQEEQRVATPISGSISELEQKKEHDFKSHISLLTRYENLVADLIATSSKPNRWRSAIHRLINAISSDSSQRLEGTIAKLQQMMNGESIVMEGQSESLDASSETNGVHYCKYYVAKQIVKQSELLILKPSMAFPLAATVVSLWVTTDDFGQLLLAHMARVCPYILPFTPRPIPSENEEDFKKRLGYQVGSEGHIETRAEYESRMRGVFKLYAAISVSRLPSSLAEGHSHPHGIGNIWTLLATVSITEPVNGITPTLIYDLLDISGWKLQTMYGSTLSKLLQVLSKDYFELIKKKSGPGSGAAIERLTQLFDKTRKQGKFCEPVGMLSKTFL